MNLQDTLRTALLAIREHRLRASLSALGVVIGTASVVLLVSIGLGVRADITRQVEQLGTNVAFVLPGKLSEGGEPEHMSLIGISTLTLKDAAAVSLLPGVRAAIPVTFVFGSVERDSIPYSAVVIASDPRIARLGKKRVTEGRFYSWSAKDSDACVIGHALRAEVFGKGPALGQELKIKGHSFRVVGVLEPEEPSLFSGFSFAKVVYIPLKTALKAFPGAQINRILIETDYQTDPDAVVRSVRHVLLKQHGTEDFGVLTYRQLLGAIYRVFNIVTALIVGISAISLLVAGIGIMNVMLVSVSERTHEIGVRLTTGATPRDIYGQFLVESVLLSLSGGVVGAGLAIAVAAVVGALTVLTPLVTWQVLALAFGVCFVVGVLFGTVPAARAARLTPVEALRYE